MSRTLLVACGWALTMGLSAHDHARHPFSENKGQWPEQVLYRTLIGRGGLFVERDALTYVLRSGGHQHAHKTDKNEQPLREHAVRVQFEGGGARSYLGTSPLSYYENYYLGSDRSKWASGVRLFEQVDLRSLYPGIDLRIMGEEELKYDLLVDAGADAGLIVMRYEGQDGLQLVNGNLRIITTAGDVQEQAPVAWQMIDGRKVDVPCAFVLDGDRVRFSFPNGFDKRSALVIDPVVSFCSFTGSTADNFGFTATYDATGHLYGGGIVFGIGYPITPGVQQPNFAGNTIDVGLTKFAPDGTSLIWSTYLGGVAGNESPHSLVVNSNDELYVMGITGSSDFPTTVGCFDNSFGFGPPIFFAVGEGYTHDNGTDIFVTHFNSDATVLIGSTYVGGSQGDGVNNSGNTAYNYGDPFRGEIVLDGQERPVVATCTMSNDIPSTPGAAFPSYAGGDQDAYVFAMDLALTTQVFATFYGGTGTDACYALQLDDNDEVFATGGTNSGDLPMGGTPFDGTANGGIDGFVIRLSPAGDALLSSTYLGTPMYDQAYFVQLDTNNNVHLVGQTHGPYPVTPGKYNNAGSSQFIQKLDHGLSTSIWSTVIGSGAGTEDISPSAFLVSDCGQIYFSGWGGVVNQFQQAFASTTIGLPTTIDAFQSFTDGSDFYLMVLNQEANSLAYATFFGGGVSQEHVDGGTSRFSKTGVVYQAVCAGCGANSDLPTTPGAWSQTNNSFNCNLGVFKIDFEQGVTANIGGDPLTGCAPATINFTSTGSGTSWQWDFGDGTPGSTLQNPSHLYPNAGTYPVTLIAVDSTSCNISDTLTIDIVILPLDTLQPTFTVNIGPCGTNLVTFTNTTPGIGNSYEWDLGDGSTANSTNVTHTYPGPGTYIVTLNATEPTCNTTGITQDTITIPPPTTIDALFVTSTADFCSGLSITAVDQSTGPAGMILTWDMGDGTVANGSTVQYTYNEEGTYTITLTAFDPNCNETDTYAMTIEVLLSNSTPGTFIIPNVFSPNGDVRNDSFFPVPGASLGYVHLMVFNRWGMKLYETGTGSSYKPWDGEVRPGEKAPEGVYYYILDYRMPCNGVELKGTEKGHVQLLR